MKQKSTTIRIDKKLHSQIKQHVGTKGMKLESWASIHLLNAMTTELHTISQTETK